MTRILPTNTSRVPLAPPLAMSTATAVSTPSPLPHRPAEHDDAADSSKDSAAQHENERPIRELPKHKMRLQVEDLMHEGTILFFKHMEASNALTNAVTMVLQQLYRSLDAAPPVRSITLVLKPFDGVAFTRGLDLDNDHKEIHFSVDYIAGLLKSNSNRVKHEITGVLVHEMVHVWQWNGKDTCPGGLIEGIADFIRLRNDLAPPHWKQEQSKQWDAGYERTGYFLDWLERKHGDGTVRKMNATLRHEKYDEKKYWHHLFGTSVHQLWKRYQDQIGR